MFSLSHSTPYGRRGTLKTPHGMIQTPHFFPVGTGGAMRGLTLDELRAIGAESLLCNTYHLHLRPGEEIVEKAGGLHRFLGWEYPILTDSGGFQIFSLEGLRKVNDDGVTFRSHIDGALFHLSPEDAIRIQHRLGSDIIMCLDVCPPSTAERSVQLEAVDRTILWASRCKDEHDRRCRNVSEDHRPLLFAIVQGGLERDLRQRCAEELVAIGFDGYAVGGLAVGESEEEMFAVLEYTCPLLPEDRPRYLMGVGRTQQHREAVRRGIDLFDCVLPMREARHGKITLSDNTTIDIRNAQYSEEFSPIDHSSPSPLSQKHSRAYLHYLFRSGERSAETIACAQNLSVTLRAMRELRASLQTNV